MKGSGPVIWKTKAGSGIAIEDMTTKHIEASIAKIERAGKSGITWRGEYLSSLKAEIERRIELDQFYTGSTKDTTPFSLGMPGERWEPELPALEVPVDTPYKFVYVTRQDPIGLPWAVFYGVGKLASTGRHWLYFSDLILAAAFIHEHERSMT